MAGTQISRWFNWLDSKPAWQFLSILYALRWLLLTPYMIAEEFIIADDQVWIDMSSKLAEINPALLFLLVVVISPLLETLVECSLPFFVLSWIHRKKGRLPTRPWLFVIISAILMTLLHPVMAAVVPAFISGAYLAYCYSHFAPRGLRYAVIYTTAFHGAVNIVGWITIVLGSNT